MNNLLTKKFISSILLFVCLWLSATPYSLAQTPCTNPNPSPLGAAATWQQNAQIRVNVSGLPQNLQSCLNTALYNWNVANGSGGNNPGVAF